MFSSFEIGCFDVRIPFRVYIGVAKIVTVKKYVFTERSAAVMHAGSQIFKFSEYLKRFIRT